MILSILNNHAHGLEVRAALNPSDMVWHAMGMTRREMEPVKGAYPTLLASLRDAFGGDRVPEVCAALRPPAMFWHPFGMARRIVIRIPEGCPNIAVGRRPIGGRSPLPGRRPTDPGPANQHPGGMPEEAPGCTTSLVARVPSVPRVPVPPALSS
jgi:hypothetical protein